MSWVDAENSKPKTGNFLFIHTLFPLFFIFSLLLKYWNEKR